MPGKFILALHFGIFIIASPENLGAVQRSQVATVSCSQCPCPSATAAASTWNSKTCDSWAQRRTSVIKVSGASTSALRVKVAQDLLARVIAHAYFP